MIRSPLHTGECIATGVGQAGASLGPVCDCARRGRLRRKWCVGPIVCRCGCGDMIRIGEDRTVRLKIVPAQPKVAVTIHPKHACPKSQGGIVQALAAVHSIEGGLTTKGTLAHIGVFKCADRCPLFRQSQIYARSGLNIDRSTLAHWRGKVSFRLAPVLDPIGGKTETG